MKDYAVIQAFSSGAFPDVLAVNSTGAATQDGTEYIAEQINNGIFGWMQDLMDYASLTPDGIVEATGTGQIREAIQLGNGIGPGIYVQWGKILDPSTTGDRVLILANQGILIASFNALVIATYVGDGNNGTAPFFYKADAADGLVRDTAGPYFILPPENPTYKKQYLGDGTDFTVTGLNWTTIRAIAIPYKSSDGVWRLKFNIAGSLSVNATGLLISISGVTFKNVATFEQAISVFATAKSVSGHVVPNTGNAIGEALVASGSFSFSGDVELDSEPTWTNGYTFPWGITY